MFASMHFNNDSRFQQIRQNALALRYGAKGYHVRLLQQGLIDLGYALPKSTQRYQSPDGDFGWETKSAVTRLQSKLGLYDDGVVGTKSVIKIDPALAASPRGFAPPPALPDVPLEDIGNPASLFRSAALQAIGPGSPLYRTDGWDISWCPRPGAKPISFRINTFIDYGFSLNGAIARDAIRFAFADKPGEAGAEYVSRRGNRHGVRLKANTLLLLDRNSKSNQVLAIHELTHALLDYERGPRNALFNEMIAYIAGSLFLLHKGQTVVSSGESALIFATARECAKVIKKDDPLTQADLDPLAQAIKEHPKYHGVARQRYINNGVG